MSTKPKIHPMLFSTPMVKAILEGRKTQTRRIVKYKKEIVNPQVGFSAFTNNGNFAVRGIHKNGQFGESFFKVPINIGDVIWVRETWQETTWVHPSNSEYGYIYKASENGTEWSENSENWKWKPSLFMPKNACRLFLEVLDVRIEKLNEISENDAIEEGIEFSSEFGYKLYSKNSFFSKHLSATDSYMSLWESINGKDSWKENPFVWVYTFKLVECPSGFR
jgi:hypothetical protein